MQGKKEIFWKFGFFEDNVDAEATRAVMRLCKEWNWNELQGTLQEEVCVDMMRKLGPKVLCEREFQTNFGGLEFRPFVIL